MMGKLKKIESMEYGQALFTFEYVIALEVVNDSAHIITKEAEKLSKEPSIKSFKVSEFAGEVFVEYTQVSHL